MKKLLTISLMALLLAACGDEEDTATQKTKEETKEETSEESSNIEVDKGLLNVDITIPEDFFMGASQEEIRADAEKQGAKDITFNDDGSVTYKLSKSDHKKALDEMAASIDESLQEMADSEDYPSIQKVEAKKDYTQFDLTVDRKQFEEGMDSFAVLGILMVSSYYQVFQGKSEDDLALIVNYIDTATGKVFETEDLTEEATE